MTTYAVDFECYYDKQVSVTTLGLEHYLAHPDCDIYMVSIYSAEAGFSFVGKPADADWRRLNGQRVVAHNARFDRACFRRLQQDGVIPALALVAVAVADEAAHRYAELGQRRAGRHVAHFGVGCQVADEHYFVQVGHNLGNV